MERRLLLRRRGLCRAGRIPGASHRPLGHRRRPVLRHRLPAVQPGVAGPLAPQLDAPPAPLHLGWISGAMRSRRAERQCAAGTGIVRFRLLPAHFPAADRGPRSIAWLARPRALCRCGPRLARQSGARQHHILHLAERRAFPRQRLCLSDAGAGLHVRPVPCAVGAGCLRAGPDRPLSPRCPCRSAVRPAQSTRLR